jgi:signal transduction histidine kinase
MIQLDDRKFNRFALFGIGFGFLLLIAAFAAALTVFSTNQESVERVRHTYEVVDQLSLLEIQLERSETGRRGYLLSQSPYRLELYQENAERVPQTLSRLEQLISDNPDQAERVRQLHIETAQQLAEITQSMALALNGQIDRAVREFTDGSQSAAIRRIRVLTTEMRQAEYALLRERSEQEAGTLRQMQAVLAITGLLLLIVGVSAVLLVRRYTIDLTGARDRLHLLNTDLEGVVAERTTDLRRANDEIQRFAYIVSHDLRSPLVNILGFTAELEETNKSLGALIERAEKEAPQIITPDSRAAREDLPEAIGFIRSSTQKMDRLINAILRLSREGRRTLVPEHLPMAKVLGEITASMEHKLAETGTVMTVEQPMPDLVSDRVAIEQIFSNLLENAVKYLKPGTPGVVTVRGAKQGDRILYEVEDNGRGIDPKDHERVFDLFRRSGPQDQPGEGIGLAHVRALAYRLGGFIDVKSELGQGAVFQVNLPATYADQGVAN